MESYHTPPRNSANRNVWLACGGCLLTLTLLFFCGALGAGIVVYSYWQENGTGLATQIATILETSTPTRRPTAVSATPESSRPTRPPTAVPPVTPPPAKPTLPPAPDNTPTVPALALPVPAHIVQSPIPTRAYRDLEKLFSANYPPHDYFDAANRLGQKGLTQRTISAPAYAIGDVRTFRANERDIKATLTAMTTHAYFWVENGLYLREEDVIAAANRLEELYYPRLTNLFGPIWQPGIDNDPRFSVLHLRLPVDASELGYFDSQDEYPRTLFHDSNEQEIIYLNMSAMEIGEALYYGTLVHELQHLIQWHVDPNEETWLNEGLSQLAEIYLGYETASTYYYERRPDVRLNSWNYDEDVVDAHYSAAFLFVTYLWEQLGEMAVQELSRHPANGMSAVRSVLAGYDTRTLEAFVADWAVANYLDDPAAGDAYYYRNLDPGTPDVQMRIRQFPYARSDALPQYSVHYYVLNKTGKTTISFAGDTLATLMSAPPPSGQPVWFAPGMDDTSATLTLRLNLRDLTDATLRFRAWYDLEEEWDFAYVAVSMDNGRTWELLSPDNMVAGEYGPAFGGRSANARGATNNWVQEAISLRRYAGQEILVRFEVLTDSSIVGQGFALDDVHVPEMSAARALETTVSGWQAEGFVNVAWQLPQQWQLLFIQNAPTPQVIPLPLNSLNQGQWTVDAGQEGGVLVVIPLTPFTDYIANYWLAIEK